MLRMRIHQKFKISKREYQLRITEGNPKIFALFESKIINRTYELREYGNFRENRTQQPLLPQSADIDKLCPEMEQPNPNLQLRGGVSSGKTNRIMQPVIRCTQRF
ncbi:AAEL001415-PA [Aedes aegypti]|uniref:AAEL001415-PA n=1 Tax=Aedes aegypti TaxID=7159 RepID=Q17L82_AEDAE|nr:AAEL001415-PA [Aedes aegypti]